MNFLDNEYYYSIDITRYYLEMENNHTICPNRRRIYLFYTWYSRSTKKGFALNGEDKKASGGSTWKMPCEQFSHLNGDLQNKKWDSKMIT